MKDGKKMSYPKAKLVDGYFQWVTQPFEKHQEDSYEDFYQEKNLPAMLSKEGLKVCCWRCQWRWLRGYLHCRGKRSSGYVVFANSDWFQIVQTRIV
jgi:hypothetical protein